VIDRSQISASGQVVGFRLHDATVTGLRYEVGAALELAMRRVDGTQVTVRLRDAGQIGTNGFRAPAIVADIYAWHPSQTPSAALTLPDGAWRVLFANELQGDALRMEAARIGMENRYAFIVVVACSYGGSIAALCDDIEIG
jgi:hypothetical protein